MWLKKYFKPIMFFLIGLSVLVTWYINTQINPDLSPAQKQRVDEMLVADERTKSHVWNFSRLAVGVVPEEVEPDQYALELCREAAALEAKPESVSVVDVVKLQQTGGREWEEIGFARCP